MDFDLSPAQIHGKNLVSNFIGSLTKKYKYYINVLKEAEGDFLEFVVEISEPNNQQPISLTSLKIFFKVPKNSISIENIRYRFEHEELLHGLNSSIKLYKMEEYIGMLLEYKMKNRESYFMATDFERTRINDDRVKQLEIKTEVQIEEREENTIFDSIFLTNPKHLQPQNINEIEENNRLLVINAAKLIVVLFDPQNLGLIEAALVRRLIISMGLDLSLDYVNEEFIKAVQEEDEYFIFVSHFFDFLKEFILSKVIFHVVMKEKNEKDIEYLHYYKCIKFRSKDTRINDIINNVIEFKAAQVVEKRKKLKEELKGFLDIYLSSKQYKELFDWVDQLDFTNPNIDILKEKIDKVQNTAFLKEVTLKRFNAFEEALFKKLADLEEIDYHTFIELFKKCSELNLTKRQCALFWNFIVKNNLTKDSRISNLDFVKIFCSYFRYFILYSEFLFKTVFEDTKTLPRIAHLSKITEQDLSLDKKITKFFKILNIDSISMEIFREEKGKDKDSSYLELTEFEKMLLIEEKLQVLFDEFKPER